jgi:exodeoxyribonuclease V alpha subunit
MNTIAAMPADPRETMLRHLDRWVEQGWLRELDRVFARFLAREASDADPLLLLAAALASHQLGRGHACLELDAALADSTHALALPPERAPVVLDAGTERAKPPAALLAGIDLGAWQAALAHPRLVGSGPGATPLVLVGARLYLRRYWRHERSVRQAIEARVADDAAALPDERALREALAALFPARPGAAQADWQKLACALAARHAFSIVTGGPGTGKTTTVVKLLAVLQTMALAGANGNAGKNGSGARRLRIRMAAPTGKAAARLNESIAGAVSRLALGALPNGEAVRAAIPTQVTTVHRLLGSRPDTRHFRHDASNPLPLDVLVIDEASMVDLEMMAAVFAALPPSARLVLLGDKDQLASVEAGAVLGDLCLRADDGHYTPATRDWLRAVTGEQVEEKFVDADGRPLDQAIAKLRESHRFSADSGIGKLAVAVNDGDAAAVDAALSQSLPDLSRIDIEADATALRRLVLGGACGNFPASGLGRVVGGEPQPAPVGYRHYLTVLRETRPPEASERGAFDTWAKDVLAAYSRFQLLCAVRSGPQGVEDMNRAVAQMLFEEGLLPGAAGWTLGRPVMVTRNDHELGLMNGDVGITLALPRGDGNVGAHLDARPGAGSVLCVAFPGAHDGADIRWVLPSRLQAVETVFAMTVHKSQGSEFVHAALLLPDRMSPVLTRELVYTGITRARHWFTLATAGRGDTVLQQAVARRVARAGGLLD